MTQHDRDRLPNPPDYYVDALQDRIHPESGKLIRSKPVNMPTTQSSLVALARLLLRDRYRGLQEVNKSALPEHVKLVIGYAFAYQTTNEDAVQIMLDNADVDVKRMGGALQWSNEQLLDKARRAGKVLRTVCNRRGAGNTGGI